MNKKRKYAYILCLLGIIICLSGCGEIKDIVIKEGLEKMESEENQSLIKDSEYKLRDNQNITTKSKEDLVKVQLKSFIEQQNKVKKVLSKFKDGVQTNNEFGECGVEDDEVYSEDIETSSQLCYSINTIRAKEVLTALEHAGFEGLVENWLELQSCEEQERDEISRICVRGYIQFTFFSDGTVSVYSREGGISISKRYAEFIEKNVTEGFLPCCEENGGAYDLMKLMGSKEEVGNPYTKLISLYFENQTIKQIEIKVLKNKSDLELPFFSASEKDTVRNLLLTMTGDSQSVNAFVDEFDPKESNGKVGGKQWSKEKLNYLRGDEEGFTIIIQ